MKNKEKIGEELWHSIGREVWDQVVNPVRVQLAQSQVKYNIRDQIGTELRVKVWLQVDESVTNNLKNHLTIV